MALKSGAEMSEEAVIQRLLTLGGPAYRLALRVSGSPEAAEDVLQEAYLAAALALRANAPPVEERTWFLKVVANLAKFQARSEANRKRREAAVQREASLREGVDGETAATLRRALEALEEKYRVPVALCCEEGLSQREAAAILDLPERTISKYVQVGLDRLRDALRKAGYAAAPAVMVGALAQNAPALPAGVMAAVQQALAGGLAVKTAAGGVIIKGTGAAAASAAVKGGLAMKIIVSVVAAGVLAGGAALFFGPPTANRLPPADLASPPAAPPLPPPPVQCGAPLAGHVVEHVAFALAASRRPIGGASRWAVGHGEILGSNCQKLDGKIYTGEKDSEVPLYFWNQWRQIWIVEKGEAWPIIGSDDLADEDGPAEFAKFKGDGVYGGFLGAMSSSGHTLYMSFGGLRRIQRQEDGSWRVDTVGGKGKKTSLAAGEEAKLADLGGLGSMCADEKGNMFFIQSGGIIKVAPDGRATSVITREKVQKDYLEVCEKKWPGCKPKPFELGAGESCTLLVDSDGTLFGGGRCYPSGWKVTPAGQFVPICNYAQGPCPADVPASSSPWGPGDPAYYQPGCSYGIGISEGYLFHVNESTSPPLSRYEVDKNQVTTLQQDGTWSVDSKKPWGAFFQPMVDGTMAGNAPRNCGVVWVRMRKAATQGTRP